MDSATPSRAHRHLPVMGAGPMVLPDAPAAAPAVARTIHFVSLGCPKNRVDTEVMAGVADRAGYRLVAEPNEASVIVVNTCGFIGPAKEESVDTILEMGRYKEAGSCERLVVAGCLAQRYPTELAAEMPEVDHFVGTSDLLALGPVLAGGSARMSVSDPGRYVYSAQTPRLRSTARHLAWVKIAEGCSRHCAFCAIPAMRGTQRSRPVLDVVAEVRGLVETGAVEVNLVSQDTIAYGRDLKDGTKLAELLHALAGVDGLAWLRVFYLYPEQMSDELLDVLAEEPRIVKYVDMPLQHASSAMLRAMKRGVEADRQRRVVERIRERIPGVSFRTAFIVGHPGETDADFEELCELVRWARFEHMGVFRYSDEEGTGSAELSPKVPAKIAAGRHRKLMALQRKIARMANRALVGKDLDVLVEGTSEESEFLLQGRHAGQAPEIDGQVYLANCGEVPPAPGSIVRATVTQAADFDLVATLEPGP
jgi:ribosomal protein S12 methylthiotransferase